MLQTEQGEGVVPESNPEARIAAERPNHLVINTQLSYHESI